MTSADYRETVHRMARVERAYLALRFSDPPEYSPLEQEYRQRDLEQPITPEELSAIETDIQAYYGSFGL